MKIENFTIENGEEEYKINVKRFRVPAIIKWVCPACGSNQVYDCSEAYFSYPTINSSFKEKVWCTECHEEVFIPVKIKVTVVKGDQNG